MSRDMTEEELRAVYKVLKKKGLCRYDYDELVRIDKQGRLLMSVEDAQKVSPACKAILSTFSEIAAIQIVASAKDRSWHLYLEIDDDSAYDNTYLDGFDNVIQHVQYLPAILDIAKANGINILPDNVHIDIQGKSGKSIDNEDSSPMMEDGDCGGAAAGAGGDAGAAAGDAGGVAVDSGDIGTSTSDVIGDNCNHKCDGYFGPGCFHRPFLVGMPRRRIPYFISRKKKKKKKTQKIGPNKVEVIYDYNDLVSEKDQ